MLTRRRPFVRTSSLRLTPVELFKFGGLNMVDPDELQNKNQSPYAQNFRLFAQDDLAKRVALSKRSGHSRYSVPVGETVNATITSVTGAADKTVSLLSRQAQKMTPSASGRLTMVELNVENTASGTGPYIVKIYSDNAGSPGNLLATSSIASADIASIYSYLPVHFMEAPEVTNGTPIWVVSHIQDEGTNNYYWSSTTSATTAKVSINGGNTWSSTAYALNCKLYISTDGKVKGQTRFYRSTASPKQVFAFGTNVYTVNDNTGAVTSIKGSLNAAASIYDFVSVNDRLYWVNGLDAPQMYNGTVVAAAGGSPITASQIELHQSANSLFYLQPDTNYVVFTDAGDYETIQATSFIYIPSPKTSDPVITMKFFQNTMVFFTRNNKYNLYGTDLESFELREAPAKKGCISPTGVASDKSYIYFMGDDGVYQYNGGTEVLISQDVNPIIQSIADKTKVTLQIYDKLLYVYYRSSGQANSDNVLIYDTTYGQWLHDTDVYLDNGIAWSSQSDDNELVRGSSLVGALYYGNDTEADCGKPIDFEYRTKYFSFGHPSAKHRIKRLYAHLWGQDTNHQVDVQVDADEQNSVKHNYIDVSSAVHYYGESGLLYGADGLVYGNTTLNPQRLSVPGSNRKHQFRFVQRGAYNKADILGLSVYVEPRNPV